MSNVIEPGAPVEMLAGATVPGDVLVGIYDTSDQKWFDYSGAYVVTGHNKEFTLNNHVRPGGSGLQILNSALMRVEVAGPHAVIEAYASALEVGDLVTHSDNCAGGEMVPRTVPHVIRSVDADTAWWEVNDKGYIRFDSNKVATVRFLRRDVQPHDVLSPRVGDIIVAYKNAGEGWMQRSGTGAPVYWRNLTDSSVTSCSRDIDVYDKTSVRKGRASADMYRVLRSGVLATKSSAWNGKCPACGRGTYTGFLQIEHEGGSCAG